MPYLRNAWYAAAWDSEVETGTILSRRLLGVPVVMFRDELHRAVALGGVCPHRYAPLARGRVVGNAIQCGYHGLSFGSSGACVASPYGAPPKTLNVTSYPIEERHGMIWLWAGDAGKADPSLVPDYGFQDPDKFYVGKGYLTVKANYELEIENILDLSHIEFLHADTLGSNQVSSGKYECQQDDNTVWSNRNVYDEVMSDELSINLGFEPGTHVDRWIHVKWTAPANMSLYSGAVEAGQPAQRGREFAGGHLFTPETERSSHYWFSASIPKAVGPQGADMAQRKVDYLKVPFEREDKAMLEDQQDNIGERSLGAIKLGWLPGDAAGGRARAILAKMIAAESDLANIKEPATSDV